MGLHGQNVFFLEKVCLIIQVEIVIVVTSDSINYYDAVSNVCDQNIYVAKK
jgi:hypothetical protein